MSEALSYDAMGEIATLNTQSAGMSTYSYNGNQLSSISGGSLTTGSIFMMALTLLGLFPKIKP